MSHDEQDRKALEDNVRRAEHDLIKEAAPVINQMGIDAAARNDLLNSALRAQLRYVHEQLQHYIPTEPRGWGDDNQMPHEWGSMDTYDDMRNSMRFCALLMDNLLDPFNPPSDDQVATLREYIVLAECGTIAIAADALTMAGIDDDNEDEILEPIARRIEKERGLERNTIYPTSPE